jgi:hypothetical protein
MWFNQNQSQNQNQSDAHGFSCGASRCRAVEDQLFTRGAQGVALASFYPQQHIPDPIQIPLVEVVAGPASLACVPQQAVQESIGKNQCMPVSHRATRHFLAAMNDGRRWLRCPIGPDLSTQPAGILKELRNISCQFSDHANGPLTLSALRRFGWVLPQPVRRSRSRNQETGRRGHSASRLPAHRFDESPDDYSLASCSPAELASASPSDHQLAIDRPAEPLLTIKRRVCILPRVSPMGVSPDFPISWDFVFETRLANEVLLGSKVSPAHARPVKARVALPDFRLTWVGKGFDGLGGYVAEVEGEKLRKSWNCFS